MARKSLSNMTDKELDKESQRGDAMVVEGREIKAAVQEERDRRFAESKVADLSNAQRQHIGLDPIETEESVSGVGE